MKRIEIVPIFSSIHDYSLAYQTFQISKSFPSSKSVMNVVGFTHMSMSKTFSGCFNIFPTVFSKTKNKWDKMIRVNSLVRIEAISLTDCIGYFDFPRVSIHIIVVTLVQNIGI